MAEKGSAQLWKSKESFLELFFYGVAQFMFEPAKELMEREKENSKSPGTIWLQFCGLLVELVNAEKLYYTLTYIERRILRRDVVRPLYDKLHTDLKKIETATETSVTEHGDITEAMTSDLAKQLSHFISARKEMIDFYAKMAKNRWENKESDDQLVKLIENIMERHGSMFYLPILDSYALYGSVVLNLCSLVFISRHGNEFHHPILDSLKTGFSLESEIVQCLCKAESEMQQWNFFPSLLLLYQCQTNLNTWTQLVPPGSVREIAIQGPSKSSAYFISMKKGWHVPFLYRWLYQVHLAAISKFSLYFHTTLSTQTNPTEMKVMTAKTSIDYFAKITTFIRKSDAFNVSLVLDTTTMEHISAGHGYFLPNIERDRPTGKDTYPAIVSLFENSGEKEQANKTKLLSHWPSVISLLNDRHTDLAHSGRIVYYFDIGLNTTYYIMRVDVRIFMLVIFNGRRKEKDSYVTKFMTETRSLLCYEKNYQMLKPRQAQKFRT